MVGRATERGRKMINSQAKGKRAERDLASWLREQGWPNARRHVRTGDRYAADEGDIRLDIGANRDLVIECKHYAAGLTTGDVVRFLDKLVHRQCRGGDIGVLVERPTRVSDVGRWWAYLSAGTLATLVSGRLVGPVATEPVRMALSCALTLVEAVDARFRAPVVANASQGKSALINPYLDALDEAGRDWAGLR